MPEIVHRIGVRSRTCDEVFQAFSTLEGLAAWWTRHAAGDAGPGGRVSFGFPSMGPSFQVVGFEQGRRICWRCADGPADWIGTEIDIRLEAGRDEVVVLFSHLKWRTVTPEMHHCSTQWAYFLLGLKRLFEQGAGTPFGGDFAPISGWSPGV